MGVNGIYGLSGSGLDIESMVKVGMMSKQSEYNKMQQKLTTQTWTKEAFNTVYSDLSTYNYSTLSQYKMQSTMNAMNASSTNESAVKATANGAAASMTHTVNVQSMASNAYLLTGNRGIDRAADDGETKSSSIYLKDVINVDDWSDEDSLSFTINDGENTATIKLTKADITDSQQTLYDLASKITSAKSASGDKLSLTGSYDATNDAFAIYNNTGGSKHKIEITVNDKKAAELLNNLNLQSVKTETTNQDGTSTTTSSLGDVVSFSYDENDSTNNVSTVSGEDGKVIIDGKTYTTENNRVTASNVTYTLAGIGSSTVNVTQDTDAIIEKVKSFVEDYNKLLDGLYEKYSEVKYSDYKPLTDAQKEQMSEEQVEKWEKKAKSGMLYHDATIGKILDKMRTALATPVEGLSGKYNSAFSLGIDTSKTNGHIRLDEDKLKKALAAEPESVYAVFGTLPQSDSEGNYDYNSMGIAQRLGDVMTSSMREVKSYAGESSEMADGSTLGNLMQELQTKMSNFKTMMSAFESKLYKKYDALEVALSQLGTQLNYITGGQ